MSYIAWIASIFFAGLLCWSVVRALMHRHLTVEEATLSLFKLVLQHRDIASGTIPDAALIDIIALEIAEAKELDLASGLSDRSAGNWRRRMVPLLDKQASLIEDIMRHGPQRHLDCPTTQILLKYGVVEPDYPYALSTEQFTDAARRGTLYAELDERATKREVSCPL